jgi:chorismate dehydratase
MVSQIEQRAYTRHSQADSTDKLVVGRNPFLSCAPYFYRTLNGLDNVQFLEGNPAQLSLAMQDGALDCAPVSSIEYSRNYQQYFIIPDIYPYGRSKIKSSLFFCRIPWERINGQNIFLSPAAATSNLLFQILCRRRYEVDPVFNIPEEPAGRIATGNEAVAMAYNSGWHQCFDLAEEWYKWQTLPFAFSLWIVRRAALENKKEAVQQFIEHIHDSRRSFLADPGMSIHEWLMKYPVNVPERIIAGLFEDADYSFTPLHEKSLVLFFKMAEEMGYTTPCPALHFLNLSD